VYFFLLLKNKSIAKLLSGMCTKYEFKQREGSLLYTKQKKRIYVSALRIHLKDIIRQINL
jgi:hypothetical protein